MRKSALFLLSMSAWPAQAIDNVDPQKSNQVGAADDGWKTTVQLSAQPVFGSSLKRADDNDLIDNAEYAFGLSIDGPIAESIRIKPALTFTSSPNIFDAADVESSATAGAQFIYKEHESSKSLSMGYRMSLPYSGTFEVRKRIDHIMSTIIEFDPKEQSNGLKVGSMVGLNYTASGDKLRSRVTPSVAGQLSFPIGRVNGEVKLSGDVSFYTNYSLPSGKQRRDKNLQVQYLVDIGKTIFCHFPKTWALKAGVRYERNWSGVDDFDRSEWYAILSVSVKFDFLAQRKIVSNEQAVVSNEETAPDCSRERSIPNQQSG